MAKKKNLVILESFEDNVPVHVSIPNVLTGAQIRMRTGNRSHARATCTRCSVPYAYTGKNPKYCPACLSHLREVGRV